MRSRIFFRKPLSPKSDTRMDYQTFENIRNEASKKTRSSNYFFSLGMTVVWIIVLIALLTVLLKTSPIYLNLSDEKFLEIDKCPACFGVNLCPAFLTREIMPDSWSQYKATQLVSSRNVFLAKFRKKQVVLKKLGHDHELEHLDDHIVKNVANLNSTTLSIQSDYSISKAVRHYTHKHLIYEYATDLQGSNTYLVQHLKVFDFPPEVADRPGEQESKYRGSDLLLCPSQRKFDYFEERFINESLGVHRLTSLYNLMTVLLLNSEPLIFQAFPPARGWPFPEYLGACGRFIVEEYVGPNLAEWLPRVGWRERMNAALQMLLIAEQLTDGADGFRLYATDLSVYNVAVDSDKHLKIIDAENIVVVDIDQIKKDRPKDYNLPYISDNAGCQDFQSDPHCVSYNEEAMCHRLDNDHNFFAVCRELYSDYDHFGLLNGLPDEVISDFPQLAKYQQDCFSTSEPGGREKAGRKIVSTYSQILSIEQ